MMNINLICFNYAYGSFTNGPGISCWNFTKFCNQNFNIYTVLKSDLESKNIKEYNTNNSNIVHWWSGLDQRIFSVIEKEKKIGKKLIIGPNLLDGVNPKLEIELCNKFKPDLILVVNKDIKYKLKKYLKYRIEEFMTGPDYDLWKPSNDIFNKILWKGNPSHESKDIGTALELQKKIVDKMDLIGYPSVYRYPEHIGRASRYAGFVSTSLSETKSEAVLEQMAAGIPCITHPGVFMMGQHYKTGIVVEKNIDAMAAAANRILEDRELREDLAYGARSFILENFSKEKLSEYYKWLLNEC